MGYITPEFASSRMDSESKKIISNSIRRKLLERITTIDSTGLPVEKTIADSIGEKLVNIALFSESEKCSLTAINRIKEYVEGKPAVQSEQHKEEIPTVVFNLSSPLKEQLESRAIATVQDDTEDEESSDEQQIAFKLNDEEEITL